MTPIPKKRFYKAARVEPREGCFTILLDGKPIRTPERRELAAPTIALAEAIAAEWNGAGDRLDLDRLKLTRLAMTAVDRGDSDRTLWTDEILKFARSDLLCYRASEPRALTERQAALWSPYLRWAEAALDARFIVTSGIAAVTQPSAAIDAAAARLAALGRWRLLGARRAAEITGSAILALALESGDYPPSDVLAAARLDEAFQTERWGADQEAVAREARIASDFEATAKWLELLQAP